MKPRLGEEAFGLEVPPHWVLTDVACSASRNLLCILTQSFVLWFGTANDEIVVLRKPTVNRWLGLG